MPKEIVFISFFCSEKEEENMEKISKTTGIAISPHSESGLKLIGKERFPGKFIEGIGSIGNAQNLSKHLETGDLPSKARSIEIYKSHYHIPVIAPSDTQNCPEGVSTSPIPSKIVFSKN
ncbi:MAG: hypothetical protein M1450_04170 [Patescibacteria group bacterium]|nr:hypothetical protein [Patescibacteria group bacterium]